MYRRSRDYGQKGAMVAALSGIDIALWDLKGRALGVPVSTLLGGRHTDVLEAYASGCYFRERDDPAADTAREAEGYASEGFRWIKMKVGQLPEEDAARVRAARRAVGADVRLMIDANHAFSAHHAIRLAREVAECRPYWFEEPVAPEDYAGYEEVRRALSPLGIAIAGGEGEYTRFGFRELCGRRCVDIAQPDLGAAGGFTDGLFIAGLANAHGVEVLPHCWGSAVALAAGMHYLALPNCPGADRMLPRLIEFDRMENPLRDELVPGFPERDGSRLRVPTAPGLGIEIDESRLAVWG
jgi:D-galactarolactone cycloisomerase